MILEITINKIHFSDLQLVKDALELYSTCLLDQYDKLKTPKTSSDFSILQQLFFKIETRISTEKVFKG